MIAQSLSETLGGWEDIRSDMEMIVRSPNGKELRMKLISMSMVDKGKGEYSKVVFNHPPSLAGTTLLSFSYKDNDKEDEQWMYVPKSKRVKRIGGKNKSRAFVGSQYSFEDLASFKLENYRYRFLREEACGKEHCQVLISYPEYRGSAYSKLISWIDSKSRVAKTEYYDRDGDLLKTLLVKSYQQLNDKYWQPTQTKMVNHQNKKTTELILGNVQINSGLSLKEFDKATLNTAL